MIRVRLLKEPEFRRMLREGTCAVYGEWQFARLLDKGRDFSDEASRALLRTLHGEAMADKCCRRVTQAGKPCLPALSSEAKYGLTALANSADGVYTIMEERFFPYETGVRIDRVGKFRNCGYPMIWDVFAALDRDVLLALRAKDIPFMGTVHLGNDFLLENYPWHGVPTMAWVEERRLGATEQDGMLRVSNSFHRLRFDWTQDTEEVLDTLRRLTHPPMPLACGEMSLDGFRRMCRACLGEPDDPKTDGEPARPDMRVFNHMAYLPDAHRPELMVVEAHDDGRCRLDRCFSENHPSYLDLLAQVMDLAIPDGEVVVLAVDTDEPMHSARDIERAMCAFRLVGRTVETYGRQEGLQVFEETLRRACGRAAKEAEPE